VSSTKVDCSCALCNVTLFLCFVKLLELNMHLAMEIYPGVCGSSIDPNESQTS
jgi:hypothetical protein